MPVLSKTASIALGVLALCAGGRAGATTAPVPAPASPASPATAETDKQDYSAAEKLLFMSPQLARVRPPQTLRYSFRKAGSFETGFSDQVAVAFSAAPDGACCTATSEFLSAERRLRLPEVPAGEGNPVILYFLEHDVREMQRLTTGSQNHFRKMLRMAIYNGSTLRELSVRWRGQPVKATEISLTPFTQDPNRPKYEKFAGKEYRFVLSDAVPGGVYAIRTQIPGTGAQATPLIVEELYAEGAEP